MKSLRSTGKVFEKIFYRKAQSATKNSQSSNNKVESFPRVSTIQANKEYESSKQNFASSVQKCSASSNSVPFNTYMTTLRQAQQATLSVHIRGKPKGTATLVEMFGCKCIIGSNKILRRKIIYMEIQVIEFIMPNGLPLTLNPEGIASFYEHQATEFSIIILAPGIEDIFEEKGAHFINTHNASIKRSTNYNSVITCEAINEELVLSQAAMVHFNEGNLEISNGDIINDNGIQISHSFEASHQSIGAPIIAIERTKNSKNTRWFGVLVAIHRGRFEFKSKRFNFGILFKYILEQFSQYLSDIRNLKSTSPSNWSPDFAHSANHPRQNQITNFSTKHPNSSTSDSCSEELAHNELTLHESDKPLPKTMEETHPETMRPNQIFQNPSPIYENIVRVNKGDNSDCTTSQPANQDQLATSIKTIDVSLPNTDSKEAAVEKTTLDANTTVEVENQETTERQFIPQAPPNKYERKSKQIKSPFNKMKEALEMSIAKQKAKEDAELQREAFDFFTQYRGDKQGKYLKVQLPQAKTVLKNSEKNLSAPVERKAQPLKQPMQSQIGNHQGDEKTSPVSSVSSYEHSSRESIPQSYQEALNEEVRLTSKEEAGAGEIFTPNSRSIVNITENRASVSSISTQHNFLNTHEKVPESQIFQLALTEENNKFNYYNKPFASSVSSQPLPLASKNKSLMNASSQGNPETLV